MNKIYSKYKKIINLLLLLIIYIVPAVIITLYAIKRLDINFFLGTIILIFFWGTMLHISIIKMIKTDQQYLCFFWIVVSAFFLIYTTLLSGVVAGHRQYMDIHSALRDIILMLALLGALALPVFIIILCVGYIIIGLYKYYFYKEKKHLIIAIVSFVITLIIISSGIFYPPMSM